MLDFGRQLFLV